jgi:hypothetical protein
MPLFAECGRRGGAAFIEYQRRSVSLPARPTRLLAVLTSTSLGGALLLAAVLPAGVFAANPVTHYVMTPTPIAATASLAAGASKTLTVSAEDATNALVPGATIYLSLSQTTGGGSATIGTTVLTSVPVAVVAKTGQLSVTYKTPAVLPTGGKDIVKAQNAKTGPTISSLDSYSFAKVARYTFSPTPLAPPGSFLAGATASVTVTSLNSASAAVPGAVVYLSFVPATGGGSASVGVTLLTSTPAAFISTAAGQIVVTYHAPAVLPAAGTDTLSATDASKNATITRTDSYTFAGPASYAFSPSPIAVVGTLTAGKTVTVKVTALDAGGNPVAGALVWVYFVPAAGGGTASVGSKALSATPAKFLTSTAGTLTVTYKASAAPPVSGTDTITVENFKTAPTVVGSDIYTY